MERKITVLSNKGANTTVITSTATTLGELKEEMAKANITYAGMSIFEGISKTELMDDSSILPSNLPYKGLVTNDLVILLSVKDKKITSGASARESAYAAVKAQGLQEAVVAKFGRNFTQVSTVDLVEFVAANAPKSTTVTNVPTKAAPVVVEETAPIVTELPTVERVADALLALVSWLYEDGIIEEEAVTAVNKALLGTTGEVVEEVVEKSPYSKEETAQMFNFLN